MLLESDVNYKVYQSGKGEVPHQWVCAYFNITFETLKGLPGVDIMKLPPGIDKKGNQKTKSKKFMIKVETVHQMQSEQWLEQGYDIFNDFKFIPKHKRKEHFKGKVEFNNQGQFIGKHKNYVKI